MFRQTDEPVAPRNLQHFDHSFKGELHTVSGSVLVNIFGACKFAKRAILVVCKGSVMSIVEEVGITSKTKADLSYSQVPFP